MVSTIIRLDKRLANILKKIRKDYNTKCLKAQKKAIKRFYKRKR